MKPEKVFGFIFFQRKYDGVVCVNNEEQAYKLLDIVRAKHVTKTRLKNSEYKKMNINSHAWIDIVEKIQKDYDVSQECIQAKKRIQKELAEREL